MLQGQRRLSKEWSSISPNWISELNKVTLSSFLMIGDDVEQSFVCLLAIFFGKISVEILCTFRNSFLLIYLFLAVLGLRCHAGFSLAAASGDHSLVVVCGLLTGRLLLLWSRGSGAHVLSSCSPQALELRLGSCGSCAELPRGMQDLPGSRMESMSPETPGKPLSVFFNWAF